VPASLDGIAFRPATQADLLACEDVWRVGLDGYLGPLGFPDMPVENPGLRRLHAHTLATDPSRFWVATEAAEGDASDSGRVVAFGSAVLRGLVWFLSMLFVYPEAQGRGIGRAILERILPPAADGIALATATDAAQPVSNALYASLGIVPRMPLFNLVGRPWEGWQAQALPMGVRVLRVTADLGGFPAERDALDREVLGFARPGDHAYAGGDGRYTFAYTDDAGALLGYGYAADAGRVGPIAVRDPKLLAPILAHLLVAVEPRGASSTWLPGASDEAIRTALEAGLRIEGFPTILCWSRPFADFSRYTPISPGLL
jgi:GNAT superfamily N-acetyltransferase